MIAPEILDQNRKLDITPALMFVNKITFLVTPGQRVKFTTMEKLLNPQAQKRLKGMASVVSLYYKQNYSIYNILTDN